MLLKSAFSLTGPLLRLTEPTGISQEKVSKIKEEPKIDELSLVKGRVNDKANRSKKYALAIKYPGRYLINLSFTNPRQYEKGLFAPNIDLLIDQTSFENDRSHWLGDIDAAFGAYTLNKPIHYLGHGRYVIDGKNYEDTANPIYLMIEGFDTNHSWVDYKIEIKDANPK